MYELTVYKLCTSRAEFFSECAENRRDWNEKVVNTLSLVLLYYFWTLFVVTLENRCMRQHIFKGLQSC